MLGIIIGAYFLGIYLDEKYGHTTPFYQKWVGITGVFLAIVSVLVQVIRLNKDK